MSTFKIWFCAALAGTALMLLTEAKAAPSAEELCTWGE